MASITASGLGGSGLDVNSIVSQLMAVEQQPITALDTKEASYQAKLTAVGTIKSGLASLQTATSTLTSSASNQLKATPSDPTAFSATASVIAVPGTYSVDITKLAQAQSLAAAGRADITSAIGSGTLTFDFGTIASTLGPTNGNYSDATFTSNGAGTRTVTIDNTNNSLGGIRDAINAAGIGVTASIVNDGSSSPYRLVLSSANSGVANSMSISVAGDPALSNLLSQDYSPTGVQNLSETIPAQNAQLKVNGISASKSSNIVTDVITGVTLNLAKQTTSTATVTVAGDTSGISAALDAFVKAFNDENKSLTDLSAYDPTNAHAAVLQGDSLVWALKSQLQNVIGAIPSGVTGSFKSLSQIGVSFQRDGTLVVDAAKLQNAMSSNSADVAAIIAKTGGALNTVLDNQLSSTGLIAGRTDGISQQIKSVGDQRTKLTSKLADTEQKYRTQYAALDAMLSTMKATSDALTQELAGLPSNTTTKTG